MAVWYAIQFVIIALQKDGLAAFILADGEKKSSESSDGRHWLFVVPGKADKES